MLRFALYSESGRRSFASIEPHCRQNPTQQNLDMPIPWHPDLHASTRAAVWGRLLMPGMSMPMIGT